MAEYWPRYAKSSHLDFTLSQQDISTIILMKQEHPPALKWNLNLKPQSSTCCTNKIIVARKSTEETYTVANSPNEVALNQEDQIQQQPEKTATILRQKQWFTREMTSEKRAQKFHTDDKPLARSGLVHLIGWKFASSNQKHYPDPGSDALSAEKFCVRSSDTISWGNQWVGREMFAVFPR